MIFVIARWLLATWKRKGNLLHLRRAIGLITSVHAVLVLSGYKIPALFGHRIVAPGCLYWACQFNSRKISNRKIDHTYELIAFPISALDFPRALFQIFGLYLSYKEKGNKRKWEISVRGRSRNKYAQAEGWSKMFKRLNRLGSAPAHHVDPRNWSNSKTTSSNSCTCD